MQSLIKSKGSEKLQESCSFQALLTFDESLQGLISRKSMLWFLSLGATDITAQRASLGEIGVALASLKVTNIDYRLFVAFSDARVCCR